MSDELREQAIGMLRDALQIYGSMVQDSRTLLPVAEDIDAGQMEVQMIDAVGDSKLYLLSLTETN